MEKNGFKFDPIKNKRGEHDCVSLGLCLDERFQTRIYREGLIISYTHSAKVNLTAFWSRYVHLLLWQDFMS